MTHAQLIASGFIALLLVLEAVAPFYVEQRQDRRQLFRHDLRNLLLGLFNAFLPAALFAGSLLAVDQAAADNEFGILRLVSWPAGVELAAALLLFDLWMYVWHRLNHRIPLLWRFHRMHHSDRAMDVTSGVRFHPGEIILSGVARLAVVPLLGMSIMQLAIYESILLPVILFHHSNLRLPKWIDFGAMTLLVTPAMHRVHHSRLREETNSNYGSVLPWWDWLFRTLRIRRDSKAIKFGLPEFHRDRNHTLLGMLRTPLAAHKKTDDP